MEEKIIFQDIEFFPIPKYDKYYASRCGQIYSGKSNRIMKYSISNVGYKCLPLGAGKTKVYNYSTVHALIAATFLGERPKGYFINHKDFDKLNNNASNLEYVTPLENNMHSYENKKLIRVYEYDKEGNFIAEYRSITAASKFRKISNACIYDVLNGQQRYTNGRYYTLEKIESGKPRVSLVNKLVSMYDLQGNFIKSFESAAAAALYAKTHATSILECCKGRRKTAGGFTFKYA